MVTADLAYHTLQTFLAALPQKQPWRKYLSYYNPTLRLNGHHYLLYQENLAWDQWRQRYTEAFQTPKRLDADRYEVFFRLCRATDLEYLTAALGKDHPYCAEWYFEAGQYEAVRTLPTWPAIKDQVLTFSYEVTRAKRRRIRPTGGNRIQYAPYPEHTVSISTEDRLRLCARFHALGLIGHTPIMIALYQQMAQLAERVRRYPEQLPNILVTGPSGSGKELVSRAIGQLCGRPGPFEVVNCANIPEHLLESELFGHEKGAFTGADTEKKGLFEVCAQGTVQLDEINTLPQSLQAKILRALEERSIRRVGGETTRPIDVLFIAATNENLAHKVRKGAFAHDLYQRLAGTRLQTPALYDRLEDIPLLVNHFLTAFPGNPLDAYRFPLAMGLLWQAIDRTQTIRTLRNTIGHLVSQALPLEYIWDADPHQAAIRQAVQAAVAVGQSLPLTKTALARHIQWKERVGIAPSNFYVDPWRSALVPYLQNGQVKP